MRWQKRARLGIAAFGIGCAIVVYAAIEEREPVVPPAVPARLDPKAVMESEGAEVQQERGAERDFDIRSAQQLMYEDGSSKLVDVEIHVRGREGRDFVLAGREARAAGRDATDLQLSGAVKLSASDGFVLTAEHASFTRGDGTVRAPGPIAFEKGQMRGSGVGMTYDQEEDLLTLLEEAEVAVTGEDDQPRMQFSAGSAALSRLEDSLLLEGSVHVLRGEQVFEADRVLARLTPGEEAVTFVELRGNARVIGGDTALDSMSARDIDLDYGPTGERLDRVTLTGDAAIAMSGDAGAAGYEMTGGTLALTLAGDGAVTSANGRDDVQLTLPASGGRAARLVSAQTLDATGESGRGLTAARFTGDVEYREDSRRRADPPRVARSHALEVTLDAGAIGSAVFTGAVTFEDQGLRASGATTRYSPEKGTLRISGTDEGGPPRVADRQIAIEAQRSIDVTLEGRQMHAAGGVETSLRSDGGASKLPGLLEAEQPANVNADSVRYDGTGGDAVYTGDAALWQGQTAIRADTITIARGSGDLVAAGRARSTIELENGTSTGSAAEIRYADAARTLTYAGTPLAPARLIGPQGHLEAADIDVVLAAAGGRVDRLEARTGVTARVDARVATGAHLTYFAEDERYVMTSAGTAPVKIVDGCRETIGRTLIFFRTADRIVVDGNEEIRTQTTSGGPCAGTPAR